MLSVPLMLFAEGFRYGQRDAFLQMPIWSSHRRQRDTCLSCAHSPAASKGMEPVEGQSLNANWKYFWDTGGYTKPAKWDFFGDGECRILKCQVNKSLYRCFHLYCTRKIQQLPLPGKLIIGKVNAKWPQEKRQQNLITNWDRYDTTCSTILSLPFPPPKITLSVIQQSFYLLLLMENCDNDLWIIGV